VKRAVIASVLLLSTLTIACADLEISEFMASNATGLQDEDGDYSDWIELRNRGPGVVDLDGWYLTDDAADLTQWRFSSVSMTSGAYLVVFASGKDRTVTTNELHTSFQLDSSGEYLALVRPDGETVQHSFAPAYPAQRSDASYGTHAPVVATSLVATGHSATAFVPTDNSLGDSWRGNAGDEPFDDSAGEGWIQGTNGFGYSRGGSIIPGETRGFPLQNRATTDGASGSLFVFPEIPFTRDGRVLTWTLFSDAGDATGRTITPLLFRKVGSTYEITGIGETRTNAASGEQSFEFGLGAGSDAVQAGVHYPGFKDGSNTANNQGVIEWDNSTGNTIVWFGGGHAGNLAIGNAFTPNLTLKRTYSVQFSTGTDFGALIATDIESTMFGVSASCYLRTRFQLGSPMDVDRMLMDIRYEDGFIAFLNGTQIARRNITGPGRYDSTADTNRPNAWAAVEERVDVTAHTGQLLAGTNVLAIQGLNDAVSEATFLLAPQLTAETWLPATNAYFTTPTPGERNEAGVAGFVADTRFSVDRGFHTQAFDVTITTATDGAAVYYTTNGTAPSPTNADAVPYAGPVHINRTTVLRAAAFKGGYEPTNIDTHTYIFTSDVPQQSVMWTGITQDPAWGPRMTDALLAIPTVSLATGSTISEVESGVSIELIHPDGTRGFQQNAGVEHYGGHSLNYPKKSMRISFKREYGSGKLRHNLFDGAVADEFDQILLRTGSHDSVFYSNGTRGIYVRNRWIFDRQLEMGQPAPRGRFVHVYINGVYWGQHQLMERPEASFMAYHFGGEPEDYDALNKGVVIDGDAAAWNDMRASTTDYQALRQTMDVVNYADYMLLQFYCGNDWDWNHYQNWMAARKREPGAGFKFFAWDSDMVIRRSVNANVINRGGPANMWGEIKQHVEFKMLLADRAQRYLFNGGMLTPDRVVADLDGVADQMDLSMVAETARWGNRTAYGNYTPTTWSNELNTVRTTYVSQRTDIVIQQLRDADLLPDTQAPRFLVDGAPLHGGVVTNGSMLSITNPNAAGTTYYTLDGTDPRLAGGAVAPGATTYLLAIALTQSTRALSRVQDSGEWSALSDAVFTVPTAVTSTNLVLSELHFNPSPPSTAELAISPGLGRDDFEFVELWNRSGLLLDLGGLEFVDGIGFTFPSPSLLPSDAYVVVVRNEGAFEARYGTNVNVAGQYVGSLSDSSETIALHTASGVPVLAFAYRDDFAPLPDGDGPSMVFTGDDYGAAKDWRDSVLIGGTPGRAPDSPFRDVVINEVLSHTDLPDTDSIELHNISTGAVSVGGWWLSDSRGLPRKFVIPGGTTLEADEYAVFDEDDFNPTPASPETNHFTLNGAHGDDVWLIEPGPGGEPRRIADTVDFGAAVNGEAFGRWPDGSGVLYPMGASTFGTTNSGPRVGPVVISEIMYAYPGDTNGHLEFLEIYNPSNTAVLLENWRFVAGANYDFPAEAVLPATGVVVAVSFDPQTNAQRLAAFRSTYGIDESVVLLGPFRGRLDNTGETVRLSRPDEPPLEEPSFYPALLEDEADYGIEAPWPITPLALGDSLHRLNEQQWGHAPFSWYGASPTPGRYRPVPLAGFTLWQRTAFPYQTPAEARDWLADANGDGQPNALAYAFGFDPLSPSNSPTVFTGTRSSAGNLVVSYQRRVGATDVVYRVALSGDRTLWDDSESHVAPVGQPTPRQDGVTEEVTFRVDLGAPAFPNRHGYVRLRISPVSATDAN
jgi:hypothetical protein